MVPESLTVTYCSQVVAILVHMDFLTYLDMEMAQCHNLKKLWNACSLQYDAALQYIWQMRISDITEHNVALFSAMNSS